MKITHTVTRDQWNKLNLLRDAIGNAENVFIRYLSECGVQHVDWEGVEFFHFPLSQLAIRDGEQ